MDIIINSSSSNDRPEQRAVTPLSSDADTCASKIQHQPTTTTATPSLRHIFKSDSIHCTKWWRHGRWNAQSWQWQWRHPRKFGKQRQEASKEEYPLNHLTWSLIYLFPFLTMILIIIIVRQSHSVVGHVQCVQRKVGYDCGIDSGWVGTTVDGTTANGHFEAATRGARVQGS